ncbi:MAG: GW dipeptide domain-containing protein [Ignavibacteriaceae bacterium]
MKNYFIVFLFLGFVFSACESGNKPVENLPEGYHGVEVMEHMDAQSYTYMRVTENGSEYWIAVPQMSINDGDVVYFSKSMEMKNFESKSLNRKFESVLFVEDISRTAPNAAGQQPEVVNHPKVTAGQKANVTVEPLKDGKTIEQVYAEKNELEGKTVRVRGMVTKYNPDIMGMNWVHIQDGTGTTNYDLAVTSKDVAETGKLVIIEGTVSLNKDFGSGYSYDLIVENAKLKVE